MRPPPPQCGQCAATLSLDHMRGTNCPFCGAVLAHHAQAAEHAAVINQVINQQFSARGYAPPGQPIAPYQYGAQPNLHAHQMQFQHHANEAVKSGIVMSIVVGGVITVITVAIVVVAVLMI